MDLALNNLQRLICHKTQLTNQPIETILLCGNKGFMFNWVISNTEQYSKRFNYVQTNKQCWIELVVLDYNTWNNLVMSFKWH